VVYELYPRSFADGDGDGVGDFRGARQRLPHLAALGVDAVWVCPHYPSPLRDGGYDVVDHRDVHELYGTLAEFDAFVDAAHTAGIRVIIDLVPNHTSSDHPWFQEALAAGPGSAARRRYHFASGRGDGSEPPNDWQSVFGGPAWTRVEDGSWYLHLFDASQPDLQWDHAEVVAAFDDVLRFWLDRGVDGFRVDVASGLCKRDGYPDVGPDEVDLLSLTPADDHPHWDEPGVHEIAARWRRVVEEYDRPVLLLAEAWVGPESLRTYVRPGGYHQAFNLDLLFTGWDRDQMRAAIERALEATRGTGTLPTWSLANHDVMRPPTRFGLPPDVDAATWSLRGPHDALDPERGAARALAATLMIAALPGSLYLYQGEELGLPEAWDLPLDVLQDPTWERSGHTRKGRDGCRVPLPWEATGPSLGFSDTEGWLPQPPAFARLAIAEQALDPDSTLAHHREMLAARRALLAGDDSFAWLESGPDVLAFRRGQSLVCVVNFGDDAVALPAGTVVATSAPVTTELPADAAAWVLEDGR
jgi:alpha-glucosidase